jgi:hypothetical protein
MPSLLNGTKQVHTYEFITFPVLVIIKGSDNGTLQLLLLDFWTLSIIGYYEKNRTEGGSLLGYSTM